jgi:hypothetical protein
MDELPDLDPVEGPAESLQAAENTLARRLSTSRKSTGLPRLICEHIVRAMGDGELRSGWL